MKNLSIEQTKYTPQIDLDATKGEINIYGKSYPENTFEFYEPVLSWIDKYFKKYAKVETIISLEIIYFNSSSSKLFFDLFDLLEEKNDEHNITINWIYDIDNESALEAGEDFQDDFESLEFNFQEK